MIVYNFVYLISRNISLCPVKIGLGVQDGPDYAPLAAIYNIAY